MHWTGQTNKWQTNDRSHSGLGEANGGAILLLRWGLLILRWQLWTRYCHKVPCCMGKFNELLPILASCSFPITSRGRIYNLCARSAMFHISETSAPILSDLHLLQRNDRAMIRWKCGVTTKNQVSSQDPMERMQLDDLAKVLRTHRHRWHGHVEQSDGWLKKVQKLNPRGGNGHGHPKKTWTEVINMDHLAPGSNWDPPIRQENLEW